MQTKPLQREAQQLQITSLKQLTLACEHIVYNYIPTVVTTGTESADLSSVVATNNL